MTEEQRGKSPATPQPGTATRGELEERAHRYGGRLAKGPDKRVSILWPHGSGIPPERYVEGAYLYFKVRT